MSDISNTVYKIATIYLIKYLRKKMESNVQKHGKF